MWDLSQNDGPTANVLMHIIIYSTVYEKNIFVFISVALDFTFFFISELQLNCYKKKKEKGVTYYFGIIAQVA